VTPLAAAQGERVVTIEGLARARTGAGSGRPG
jgi:aerobic-type carbon monoxide dehydrogenase small subunit (CoxS/CutS family)